MSARLTLHSVAMPPRCTHSPSVKPSSIGAGLNHEFRHSHSPPDQEAIGEQWRQTVLANARGRRIDVIGDAAVGDFARRPYRTSQSRPPDHRRAAGRPSPEPRASAGPRSNCTRHAGNRHETRHLPGRRHRIERRPMDMAAKGDVRVGRDQASPGIRGGPNIAPPARVGSRRNAHRGDRPLRRVNGSSARNLRSAALKRPRVHSIAACASAFMLSADEPMARVVVAAHRERPLLDELHHGVDRPFGIGAIADIVAEANEALGAVARARPQDRPRKPAGWHECPQRMPAARNASRCGDTDVLSVLPRIPRRNVRVDTSRSYRPAPIPL